MRIVIDLQACQTGSRNRGIGRYAMALTEGIIRLADKHDVIIVLSGLFPKTIEPLKAHFQTQISPENIRIWYAPEPAAHPSWGTHAAQIIREAFLASLNPDIVLITSLFEGFTDNAVTSIGYFDASIPTAVILYDLIPMLYPDIYLTIPHNKNHYEQKITHLKQADLVLAISDSAKNEVQTAKLSISSDKITSISSAAEKYFKKISYSITEENTIRTRYHLHKDFLMYTGGIDSRKNIEGLIQSFAKLPKPIIEQHQLAIVCAIHLSERQRFITLIHELGLTQNDVIITGFVAEDDLIALYNLCKAFVFPSKHEGFGLPILEAMMCGAPVIGSNLSSIPEVIDFPEALFDPYDTHSMTSKIEQVLTSNTFRQTLITHGTLQARQFSWDKTAQKALHAMEQLHLTKSTQPLAPKRTDALHILQTIMQTSKEKPHQMALLLLTEALSTNQPPLPTRQLFVDISHWRPGYKQRHEEERLLKHMMDYPPLGYRIEPIFTKKTSRFYHYADQSALKINQDPICRLKNELISIRPFDCYVSFSKRAPSLQCQFFINHMSRRNVFLYFATDNTAEKITSTPLSSPIEHYLQEHFSTLHWKRQVTPAEQCID